MLKPHTTQPQTTVSKSLTKNGNSEIDCKPYPNGPLKIEVMGWIERSR